MPDNGNLPPDPEDEKEDVNTENGSNGEEGTNGDNGGNGDNSENIQEKCDNLHSKLSAELEKISSIGVVSGLITPLCGAWTFAEGYAEPDIPMDESRLFRTGSVTKTYTAAAILSLAATGELSLDETVDIYAPDIPNADRITVKNLLNHTSGLYDIINDADFMRDARENPERPVSPEELMETAARNTPLFEPGARAAYSNTNYHVLGWIIQQVSGMDAASAIERLILVPLDLEKTFLEGEPTMTDVIVPGYNPAGMDVTGLLHPTIRWTSGAMVSSVIDLLAWTDGLFSGSLPNPDIHMKMVDNPVHREDISFGLGIMIRNVPDAGPVWTHAGSAPGYSAVIMHIPSMQSSLAIIINQTGERLAETADTMAAIIVRHSE